MITLEKLLLTRITLILTPLGYNLKDFLFDLLITGLSFLTLFCLFAHTTFASFAHKVYFTECGHKIAIKDMPPFAKSAKREIIRN